MDFFGGGIDFGQRNVQIRVDVDDFRIQLLARRKNGEQRFFASGHVRVGHDDAGAGDKESRACFI